MEGREIIKRVLVVAGVVIVVGYSAYALSGFIRGPRITLRSPETGTATTTAFIVVAGRADRTSLLTLNGATTSLDLAGNFDESLLLAPGYNIMEIVATDRYGRSDKKVIEMTLTNPQTDLSSAVQGRSGGNEASTTPEQASTTPIAE